MAHFGMRIGRNIPMASCQALFSTASLWRLQTGLLMSGSHIAQYDACFTQ